VLFLWIETEGCVQEVVITEKFRLRDMLEEDIAGLQLALGMVERDLAR